MMKHNAHQRAILSPETRRLGAVLLDQQMWCWGRDICHPDGNLLVEYGFVRLAAPQQAGKGRIASAYQLSRPAGILTLWGFGLWYSAGAGIFLRRYDFRPRMADCPAAPLIWRVDELPALRMPAESEAAIARALLAQAAARISAYETWVAQRAGRDYRRRTVENFPNRRKGFISAEAMAAQWNALAVQCRMMQPANDWT